MPQTAEFHGDLVTSKRNIYTPSSFARECLLYLQEAGALRAAKPHTSRRSGLSSYLFFLVISGSGALQTGSTSYSLSAGDCVFLDCSKPYAHTTSNDLWELKWVHFNGMQLPGIYDKFLERSGEPVFRPASAAGFADFIQIVDQIYDVAGSDSYTRDMQLNELLASLLSHMMKESWHSEKNTPPLFSISDVRSYLDAHYVEDVSLDLLADHFHVNKFYLMRRFRQQYDMTIGNYLIRTRISAAKRLLRFSDLTLEEIGARVGIPDANYFSRIFKKVEGTTPSQYRKSW